MVSSESSVQLAPLVSPATISRRLPGLRRFGLLLPGVALLLAIGEAGKYAENFLRLYGKQHHLALPNIEYVLWAIVFGLIIGNAFAHFRWFAIFVPGIATYEFFLKVGIALLGVRFLVSDVLKLGSLSLVLVAAEFALATAMMVALGKWFRLGAKLTALLAVGSSICGVSAIIATQGAIEASDEDASYAIAAILALGAVSLFIFPAIGHLLHMSDHAFGLWAGLAVDNTAEATAAGALFSDEAGKWAVLAKTARNATIGFVALAAGLVFAARAGKQLNGSRAELVWSKFPKFVLGFLLLSVLASTHVLGPAHINSLANLSRWAFLLTFAGVGLRTNFVQLRRQGVRPLVVGALAEAGIAVATLAMVLLADARFRL